jgi:hypothetical protein
LPDGGLGGLPAGNDAGAVVVGTRGAVTRVRALGHRDTPCGVVVFGVARTAIQPVIALAAVFRTIGHSLRRYSLARGGTIPALRQPSSIDFRQRESLSLS